MGERETASELPLRDPPMHVSPDIARSAMQAINADVVSRLTEHRVRQQARAKALAEDDPNDNPWAHMVGPPPRTSRRKNNRRNK